MHPFGCRPVSRGPRGDRRSGVHTQERGAAVPVRRGIQAGRTETRFQPGTLHRVIGTVFFLGSALAALVALLTVFVAREMVRPPRHTLGYALAKGLPCDPGELGLAFEEWLLDRPDGARLPVWEVTGGAKPRRESGVPSPVVAVFIHGWGHSRIDMLAHMRTWHGRCDRAVFLDLRGHGEAGGSLSMLGSGETDDLLALLERLGDATFVLVGYSMGAVITLAAAASDHPLHEKIAGVFAYAPYADFHSSLRGRLYRAAQPTRPITDLAMAWLRMTGCPPRSLTATDLRAVTAPVTIVHGDADVVSPPAQVQWISEMLAQREAVDAEPSIDRIMLPGVGHELARLAQGEAHDQAVERCCAMAMASARR